MPSGGAVVEVEVFPSVKLTEAFKGVLDAVAVDNVHDDGYAFSMGVVHQGLEFLGGAEPGGKCEEIGHLIAERAVIRVLLESHDLDGVVAKLLYAGKDVLSEFLKGTNLFLLRGHADMALIDKGMRALSGVAVFPLIGFFRVPYLGAEHLCHRILNHARDV